MSFLKSPYVQALFLFLSVFALVILIISVQLFFKYGVN